MFSELLIDKLSSAKRIAVLTGAGISAESGVPTFRGENGLWNKFKPKELANFDAFMQNPELVWEWYQYRRNIIDIVQPNPGHKVLAEMEQFYPEFTISTQNIDGLHQKAGSVNILELHGNIKQNKCSECGRPYVMGDYHKNDAVPRCGCGGLIRPDVVWFGEDLPEAAIRKSYKVSQNCEIYFSIGTSALVYPAALLPKEAKRAGAFVVEINKERTPLSDLVDESIVAESGKALPVLWQLVKDRIK